MYNNEMKNILHLINNYYLYIILFVSFVATAGSLVIEYGMTLTPCELCWYQRIFMYSIFAVSLIGALIKDEKDTYKYIFGLSIPGLLISVYQYLIQLFPSSSILECSVDNPCTKIDFQLFGFLTIPLMSAIAFLAILILCIIQIKIKKVNTKI